MASFDFIDATNKGYSFAWKNRALVARLAVAPILVKFVCYLTIAAFGAEDNIARLGLILLPSIFLEGWMVAHLLRIAFFPELGIHVSGDPQRDASALKDKSRDILAGMIIYVLLKMSFFAFLGALGVDPEVAAGSSSEASTQAPAPNPGMFVLAVFMLYSVLWLLRVYFMYIPVTLGFSLKMYLVRLRGISSSFHMLAAYLMCFLPLMLLMILGFDFLKVLAGGNESVYGLFSFIGAIWKSLMEVIIEAISALVLGHGIIVMMNGTKNDKETKGS